MGEILDIYKKRGKHDRHHNAIPLRKRIILEDTNMKISYNEERVILQKEDTKLSLKRTNKNGEKVLQAILGDKYYDNLGTEGDATIEVDKVGENMFDFMTKWSDDLRADVKFWTDIMDHVDKEREDFVSQVEAMYIADHMTK